jgi:hypothetical protein
MRGSPVEVAGGNHAAWSLCEAWGWVGWPLKSLGLHCDLSLRPQRGRNMQRASPA